MATYRRYSVDSVDDVKQYGDFDAYFKCKENLRKSFKIFDN